MEIIAEAGSNHDGSVDKAKCLVDIAVNAGADSVKFQFINANLLYQERIVGNSGNEYLNPAYAQRLSEEISDEGWAEIFRYAKERQIEIFSSVFDIKGINLLKALDAKKVKISSTDFTNLELIGMAIDNFNSVILSTGMASVTEIGEVIEYLSHRRHSVQQVSLMHCVSAYPCSLEDSNIGRIRMLRELFDGEVGYSDHTLGAESAAIAAHLGVKLFEKHFTYSKAASGFDHKHALDASELEYYCSTIRASSNQTRLTRELSESEKITKLRARRGVYAKNDILVGETITKSSLAYLRPYNGMSFADYMSIIGTKALFDIPRNTSLSKSLFAVPNFENDFIAALDYWKREMSEKGM